MNQINTARAAHLKFFPATKPVNILAQRRKLIAAAQKPKPEPVIHHPQSGHVVAWRAHGGRICFISILTGHHAG